MIKLEKVKYGIVLLLILSIYSCDNLNNIDGTVVDERTNEPIDSALIYVRFKNKIIDSLSLIRDSLPKTQRETYIKKFGNKEKWINSGFDRMIRFVSTFTDNKGLFDISFHVGYFPHYELIIEKPGYERFEIKNKNINWDEKLKVFKMKKKSVE